MKLHLDPKVLHVQFDDLDPGAWAPSQDPSWMEEAGREVMDSSIQVRDAKRIVEHVLRAQARVRDVVLVAHCAAGVSRSGAVATFAAEVAGIPYEEVIRSSPAIQPNGYILRLLRLAHSSLTVPNL